MTKQEFLNLASLAWEEYLDNEGDEPSLLIMAISDGETFWTGIKNDEPINLCNTAEIIDQIKNQTEQIYLSELSPTTN